MTNFRQAFVQVLLLSLVLQFTALLTPFYIQVVIDDAIAQGDANLLFLLLIGFGVVYGLNSVTKALREWVMLTLGQSLSFDLGGNVVRHLIRLPLAYFERRHVGDLMSRVGSIQPIQSLLTRGLVNVLIDSVLFLTTLDRDDRDQPAVGGDRAGQHAGLSGLQPAALSGDAAALRRGDHRARQRRNLSDGDDPRGPRGQDLRP